jgi:hypothetical protein
LCCWNKPPDINNLKEERFFLFPDLRCFRPWLTDSVALGPVARQNIMVGSTWWNKAVVTAGKEKDRKREWEGDKKGGRG